MCGRSPEAQRRLKLSVSEPTGGYTHSTLTPVRFSISLKVSQSASVSITVEVKPRHTCMVTGSEAIGSSVKSVP